MALGPCGWHWDHVGSIKTTWVHGDHFDGTGTCGWHRDHLGGIQIILIILDHVGGTGTI